MRTAFGLLHGVVLVSLAAAAQADVWFVDRANGSGVEDGRGWPTAFREIQPAIDAAFAAGGGEVWVAAGRYDEPRESQPHGPAVGNTGSLLLRRGVHVYGGFRSGDGRLDARNHIANQTIIDGGRARGGEHAFHVVVGSDDATLDGFTIVGGNANASEAVPYGGGILLFGASTHVARCFVMGNQAAFGGGVAIRSGSPLLEECVFNGNHARSNGGALATVNAHPEIRSSRVDRNTADGLGGGLFIVGGAPILRDTGLGRNRAAQGGGALAATDRAAPRFERCAFDQNTTDGTGGAALLVRSSSVFEACQFTANGAASGGAVAASGGASTAQRGDARFTRCVFRGNDATGAGGAVLATRVSLLLETCELADNRADVGGGFAISELPAGAEGPRVTGSVFTGNAATTRGGAGIATIAVPIANSRFTGNEAGDHGGALVFTAPASALTDCRFERNRSAGWGGAVADLAPAGSVFERCQFVENAAEGWGGAVASREAASRFLDCLFTGNAAAHGGGVAIHRAAPAAYANSPVFTGSRFLRNRAAGHGGGVVAFKSRLRFAACEFEENEAGLGGAAALIGAPAQVADCDLRGNAADDWGGGIAAVEAAVDLADSTFAGNRAGGGGALAVFGAGGGALRCAFEENHAGGGGAALFYDARYRLADCVFTGNAADFDGGAVAAVLGAPRFERPRFAGNAARNGGALFLRECAPVIDDAQFRGNSALEHGGAIFTDAADATLTNPVFHGNLAPIGGAMANGASAPRILHGTFSGNAADAWGGAIANGNASPRVVNSILWGNVGGQIVGGGASAPEVRGSLVEGGHPGPGNRDGHPDFVNPSTGDLRLGAGSAALDVGLYEPGLPLFDAEGLFRPQGAGVDLGAFERAETGLPFHEVRFVKDGAGTIHPPAGVYRVQQGTRITISALAESHVPFDRWINTQNGASRIETRPVAAFTIDGASTFTARFSFPQTLQLTRTVGPLDASGALPAGARAVEVSLLVEEMGPMEAITAFGQIETLPDGWTLDGPVEFSTPPNLVPPGIRGELEFAWFSPVELPLTARYRLVTTREQVEPLRFSGLVEFRTSGAAQHSNEEVTVIPVAPAAAKTLEDPAGDDPPSLIEALDALALPDAPYSRDDAGSAARPHFAGLRPHADGAPTHPLLACGPAGGVGRRAGDAAVVAGMALLLGLAARRRAASRP